MYELCTEYQICSPASSLSKSWPPFLWSRSQQRSQVLQEKCALTPDTNYICFLEVVMTVFLSDFQSDSNAMSYYSFIIMTFKIFGYIFFV